MIRIPKRVQELKPYIAGKPIEELAREKKLDRIVKLASNENPLGPSPLAVEAIKRSASEIHRYTDPTNHDLVEALAKTLGKKPAQIICGHGIDSLLGDIIGAFTLTADELLTCDGTFIGIYVNTKKHTRTLTTVPLKDFTFDLSGILASITSKTRLIYLANPNNPTGTMFGKSDFESFMKQVPDSVLVILDEAYSTYALEFDDYPDGLDYEFENLIVTRTLSKIYGLAGARIGFAVGPEYLIRELYKVRLPFEPNLLAQQAATAALNDDEFLRRTVSLNKESLGQMSACFKELGIKQIETTANFILLLMPSEEFALRFNDECQNRGLILRHVAAFGIPNGIRINSGTIDETEFALNIIRQVYPALLNEFSKPLSVD